MSKDFDELVNEYHALVMSILRREYGGRLNSYAEDLSQDIWTKLWVNLKKNESNIVNFKSYLTRTVRTTMFDAIQALEKDKSIPVAHIDEIEHPSESEGMDAHLQVEDLLLQLKPDEARIMRAHLKGFNTEEIGVLMGCSEGRIRNLITRIKKKINQLGGG